MTCKVVRLIERDRLVLLHVSGHLQEVHVSMLEELIAKETCPVVLDLAEVALVDREAVRFLAACDVRGIQIRYREDASVAQIAKMLGISESAVKSRLLRARSHILRHIDKNRCRRSGIDSRRLTAFQLL